jgi:hypothetical protein
MGSFGPTVIHPSLSVQVSAGADGAQADKTNTAVNAKATTNQNLIFIVLLLLRLCTKNSRCSRLFAGSPNQIVWNNLLGNPLCID